MFNNIPPKKAYHEQVSGGEITLLLVYQIFAGYSWTLWKRSSVASVMVLAGFIVWCKASPACCCRGKVTASFIGTSGVLPSMRVDDCHYSLYHCRIRQESISDTACILLPKINDASPSFSWNMKIMLSFIRYHDGCRLYRPFNVYLYDSEVRACCESPVARKYCGLHPVRSMWFKDLPFE